MLLELSEFEARRFVDREAGLKTQLMAAIKCAVTAHDGQVDKIGLPYILHPMAVADMFQPNELEERIVAVLHDVLEDTTMTVRWLLAAGIGARYCEAIESITKRKGELLASYYLRVRRDSLALRVKYRDIEHNLSRRRQKYLRVEDRIRFTEKYRLALIELGKPC